SHELNQPGTYKDVKDTSATVLFKIIRNEKSEPLFRATGDAAPAAEAFLMAWTTTPWTLPSNLGLTVGPNIEYSLVQSFNPYTQELQNVIVATALLHKYFKEEGKNLDLASYQKEDKIIPWKVLA